jgi:hypothetical protein
VGTVQLQLISVVSVVVAVILAARFVLLCLNDIAGTPDSEFLYLTRRGWVAATIFTIPIGGVLYLLYGKRR